MMIGDEAHLLSPAKREDLRLLMNSNTIHRTGDDLEGQPGLPDPRHSGDADDAALSGHGGVGRMAEGGDLLPPSRPLSGKARRPRPKSCLLAVLEATLRRAYKRYVERAAVREGPEERDQPTAALVASTHIKGVTGFDSGSVKVGEASRGLRSHVKEPEQKTNRTIDSR